MSAIQIAPETAAARSFFDLRAFAARTSNGTYVEGDGYRLARRSLALAPGPVGIAAVDVDGTGRVVGLDADEFVVVVDGGLTLETAHGAIALEAGRSAVVPKGAAFAWRTARPSRLLVMTHASEGAGAGAPRAIDESAALEPSAPPPAELLVGPTPSCRSRVHFRSVSGEFTVGVWDSTPYQRRSMPYGHYELMHLLAGAVTLTDGAGRSATFVRGDIFLVEQGAHCSWRSEVPVAKVYAIFRPA